MKTLHGGVAAVVASISLAACSSGSVQQSIEPAITTTVNPLTQSSLEFEAGTANIAGTVGLNAVAVLRQNSGASVGATVLSNAPTIVGPAGFTVPPTATAADAFSDGGTNHISGAVYTTIGTNPIPGGSTFDPPGAAYADSSGGFDIVSSYGIIPAGSTNSNETPNFTPLALPFYSAANPALAGTPLTYLGGPPAFMPSGHTSTQDGTFPSGYDGFGLGFTDFQAAPVTGTYTLNIQIPTGINATTGVESYGTKTATSNVTATTVLPTWATPPAFVPDGTGGGTITTNFAGGGGVTEEYIVLVNVGEANPNNPNANYPNDAPASSCQDSGSIPYFYTFRVTPGQATVAVADNMGAAPPGTPQPHTFCTAAENSAAFSTSASPVTAVGDNWVVYGLAVDWPLSTSSFPTSSGAAAPTILGGAGQDDVTTSVASAGPATATMSIKRALTILRRAKVTLK